MKKLFSGLCVIILLHFDAYTQFDDKFYFPNKEWIAITEFPYEEFSIEVGDTATITGLIVKPDTTACASIVFFHGGGGNNSTYTDMIKPLVNGGFQVIMIDFRGYGRSRGVPTHLNIAEDGQKAFDYLAGRSDVADKKLVLYGASMGSAIATKLAKDNRNRVSGLILDGGISSFTDLAVDHSPASQRDIIKQYFKSPYSPREDISALEGIPILLISSKTDKEVPHSHAEVIYSNAKEPKEMYVYEGDHLQALQLYADEIIQRIHAMIK